MKKKTYEYHNIIHHDIKHIIKNMESINTNTANNTNDIPRIFVKSNKKSGKKIELKNLEIIEQIEKMGELDEWTLNKLSQIKNMTFKNNVFDCDAKKIVSSVRLVKISKIGRKLTPMVWEYYKNRANLDINQVIKQYGRENLIINYSIPPNIKTPQYFQSSELNHEHLMNEERNNVDKKDEENKKDND